MAHQILLQIGYATLLIVVTFFLHAIAIVIGRKIFVYPNTNPRRLELVGETVRLVLLSAWLFIAHVAAVMCWGLLFYEFGLHSTAEEAIYFAFTCYTTLGFGDIVPSTDWRLLAGACSANGLLLFGLSTAVLVDAATRHRRGPHH